MSVTYEMTDKAHPFLEAKDSLYHFIVIEIDLSITFAEIARDANSQAKRSRNIANALKAYKGALRFVQKSGLTSDQSKELQAMIGRLKDVLSPLIRIPSDVPPFKFQRRSEG